MRLEQALRDNNMLPPGRLFIFGLGYTGLHVANVAQQGGWHVSGTCRSEAKVSEIREHAINAHVLGRLEGRLKELPQDVAHALSGSTHVISTVPTTSTMRGDPILQLCQEAILSASSYGSLRWAGYLSTTGVYGDHAGEWVDEFSEIRAPAESSAAGAT